MSYHYDIYGWLSNESIPGRETKIPPMEPEGDMRPNFTGHKWVLMRYVDPSTVSDSTQQNTSLKEQINELENQINILKNMITKE